jgi:hypothetical protein
MDRLLLSLNAIAKNAADLAARAILSALCSEQKLWT